MAETVRPWTIVEPSDSNLLPVGVRIIKWTLLDLDDSGAPYFAPQYSSKVIQWTGTPGVGGAGKIQGSMEPGTPVWGTLHNPQGADASVVAADITANLIVQMLEDCYQIRPFMTGGDGTTNVTVYLMVTTTARR